jgi:hypothetical protein
VSWTRLDDGASADRTSVSACAPRSTVQTLTDAIIARRSCDRA